MPRFAANLGYLFTERPLLERIDAAAAAGFKAIELQFPYDVPASAVKAAIEKNKLTILGLNTPPGARDGEFGLAAVPGREKDWQALFSRALEYASGIGASAIHCLAGKVAPEQRPTADKVFADNLAKAADLAGVKNITLLIDRSIPAIVAGGFGGGGAIEGAEGAGEHEGSIKSIGAVDAAIQLAYASKVVIVPGYGMAVAQAQHAVRELTQELEKRGVEVTFAIHPVAGRMPGHMNVLLAEADVPYDQLKEMEDANPEFERTDVSLVIGANDVTNPAAKNTPSSPIYGMPILEVNESHSVIVIKRSMNPGFAGIENELYYEPETSMLFGDAKSAVSEITAELANI